MRCVFCQNAPLVLSPENEPLISQEEFFGFLKKRNGILEGVCITGGEPTLQYDLEDFIGKIRDSGDFAVKLDTNGLRPDILTKLISGGAVDMVAMDIKGDPDSYPRITGISPDKVAVIKESVSLLMDSGIEYEFRTTVYDGMLTDDGFEEIGKWLTGAGAYYLQYFRDSGACMTASLKAPSESDMTGYERILKKYIENVGIRG